jgi:acyl carrier protein
MNLIEKALFEWFPKMPVWVRVLTYLVFLFLFAYLLLTPRFIDGQMVWKDQATGGHIPGRGVEIQLHTEGRIYKFVSNEQGFWSVPVISRLPQAIELQIYHEDKREYFKVQIDAAKIWFGARHEIAFSDKAPYVTVARTGDAPFLNRLADMVAPSTAHAGEITLPPGMAPLAPADTKGIRDAVFGTVSKITGKPATELTPDSRLNGDGAPSYVQKIQIINDLEKKYQLVIYDEHWRYMQNTGQLAKYIEDRLKLERAFLKQPGAPVPAPPTTRSSPAQLPPSDWATIQQRLPAEQRPVFRR